MFRKYPFHERAHEEERFMFGSIVMDFLKFNNFAPVHATKEHLNMLMQDASAIACAEDLMCVYLKFALASLFSFAIF